MSEDNKIFPAGMGENNRKQFSEDELMAYLEGKLDPASQHEIEQWLADENMESDAIEGLQSLDVKETKMAISRLNYKLRKTLTNKKRTRRSLSSDQYTWMAIVIILLLAVIAYIVIQKLP